MKKIIIFYLIISLIAIPGVQAGWVDDWFNNAVINSSGPSSIKTSARGYYGLGGTSIRWQTGNNYPISINLPKVSFGCGGVDIFLGSLGLMDFDYLVSRSKSIMYAAAAFAFRYALSKMNPKAAQILEALQATANFLNQLQLNECQAGKAIAAVAMKPFSPEAAKEWGTIRNNISSMFGDSSSWTQMVNSWKSTLSSGQGSKQIEQTDFNRANQGCPDITRMFQHGSFLKAMKDKGLILNDDFLLLIRSLIGDITIDPDSSYVLYVAPCHYNNMDIITAIQKNNLKLCTSFHDTWCECSTSSSIHIGDIIEKKVKDAISNYYITLLNKQSISPATSNIISNIYYFPVYDFLLMAYKSRLPSAIVADDTNNNLIECTSYYYILGLLLNILEEARHSILILPAFFREQCSKAQDTAKCQFCSSNNQNALKVDVTLFQRNISYIMSRFLKETEKLKSCTKLTEVQTLLARVDALQKRIGGLNY